MSQIKSLHKDNAFPIVYQVLKSFFSSDLGVTYSPNRGIVVFSPKKSSHSESLTFRDFERIQKIIKEDPYSTSLKKSWERNNIEDFKSLIEKAVDQFFPSFEDL